MGATYSMPEKKQPEKPAEKKQPEKPAEKKRDLSRFGDVGMPDFMTITPPPADQSNS